MSPGQPAVAWQPAAYVFGEGLRVTTGTQLIELIPYVLGGTGGVVAGYALTVGYQRFGQIRVPGQIAEAMALAEGMIEVEMLARDPEVQEPALSGPAGRPAPARAAQ